MLNYISISSTDFLISSTHEKLWGHDHRHEKSSRRIKETYSSLFAHIGEMAKIPGHEIVYFVYGSERDVQRIGNIFSVENAARDIAFS